MNWEVLKKKHIQQTADTYAFNLAISIPCTLEKKREEEK